jgi:hypothetical protein
MLRQGYKWQSHYSDRHHSFRTDTVHRTLKGLSYFVLMLMAVSIIYAGYISIKYWTGIGV